MAIFCILNRMEIRDIEKLAKLARIELTDEEKQTFAKDLENILKYVDQIREVTTGSNPQAGGGEIGDVYNVLREDTDPHESGQFTEKILAEVPSTQDGFVKVKKIL